MFAYQVAEGLSSVVSGHAFILPFGLRPKPQKGPKNMAFRRYLASKGCRIGASAIRVSHEIFG
jgi:hypothetical protein